MTIVGERQIGDVFEPCPVSVARSTQMNLQELFEAPEIFRPLREYSQRGTDPSEDTDDMPLQHWFKTLSTIAREAWELWINAFGIPSDKLLLTEEQQEQLQDCAKAVLEEDEEFKINETLSQERLISETPNFVHKAQTGIIEYFNYAPDTDEQQFLTVLSDYQTSIWRDAYNPFPEYQFSNTPADDPDYIPPSSFEKPYWLVEPALRPFNLSFAVTVKTTDGFKTQITHPKSEKDYITQGEIEYMLRSKGITDFAIKLLTPNGGIQWEPDIRLSPGSSINPRAYQKVDSKSKLGLKFLKMFRHNPWHELDESSWFHEEENEKKLAFSRKFEKDGQKYCIWIYAARNEIIYKNYSSKVIYPQLIPVHDPKIAIKRTDPVIKQGNITWYPELDPMLIKVRMTDPDEVRVTGRENAESIENAIRRSLKFSLDSIVDKLIAKGYVFYGKTRHDTVGAIELNFLRSNLLTARQRFAARQDT